MVQYSSKSRIGLLRKCWFSRHIRQFLYSDYKKWLHIAIHVREIFNCNVSFWIPLSKCLVILAKKLWTWLDHVVSEWYFRKKYHNSDGSSFHLVAFLPLVLNKNGNTEYHGIFISFKNQLYSKQRSSILLLFGSWI